MKTSLNAWFDGGCYPKNPGGYASYGALIFKDDEIMWQGSGLIIPVTGTSNNLAEYAGYIAVLMELEKQNLRENPVTIHGDSKLVIQQMKGVMEIKTGLYVPLALKAQNMTQDFLRLELKWIPREENTLADSLASKVLFQNGSICIPCLIAKEHYQSCSCSCHNYKLLD